MLNKIFVRKLSTLKQQKIALDVNRYIYIGRQNKHLHEYILSNYFRVKIYGLDQALNLYKKWIWAAIKAGFNENSNYPEFKELVRLVKLARLQEITLVCYCIDSDDVNDEVICHGQILRNAIIYLDKYI